MSLVPEEDDDRAWAERLRELPRSIEPAADLWPLVMKAATARARAKRVRRIALGTTLALAAAVALVVGYVRHDGGRRDALATHDPSTTSAAGAAPATADPDDAQGLLPEEPAYRAALAELRESFATHENDMPQETATAVKAEVDELDAGIGETRAALAKHRQNPELQAQLRDEYQHEIDVLSDVIDLTTRT